MRRTRVVLPVILAFLIVLGFAVGIEAKSQAPKVLPAVVTSVSDGDTVHVKLNNRDERVRMIGVNCPEISHPDLRIKEQPYGKGIGSLHQKATIK